MGERDEEGPERTQPEQQPEQTEGDGGGGGGDLREARAEETEDFLDAASDVIDRALSGNSEKFLESSKQHGGQ